MPRKPLSVALLLDSPSVPAWAFEAIRRVAAEGHAKWTLAILNVDSLRQQSYFKRLWQKRHTALASCYVRLDQIISPADRNPLTPCDIKTLLADVPLLELNDDNIAAIESQSLDVIVDFQSQRPHGKILSAAKLGFWSFSHGDASRPEFAGLWEVESRDVNHSTLEMLADGDCENLILAQTCTAVDRLSAARNRSNLYWPAASLLPRQLARLHQLGAELFLVEVESKSVAADSTKPNSQRVLTNRKLLPRLARLAVRRLKRKWTKQFYRDQWFMLSQFDHSAVGAASRAAPGAQVDAEFAVPGPAGLAGPTEFQEIVPPRDRFWADPHVVCRDGKHYVFFEEYLYRSGKAHISVMELDDRGNWQPPRIVLERPYHLSYPFVFDWQGEQYMIPETSANRTLEIYRCDEFPDRWSLHKVVWNNVSAYDATLVEHAGHWWMFVTLVENDGGSSSDELFLFHADHPLSDHWIGHPSNPIVSDVRRARPAGPLFMRDGVLYRPAQDCSRTYGYGIRLHRIEELSPTSYVETEVDRIEPLEKSGWQAVHTLSFAGGLTMMDAQRRRCKFGRTPNLPSRKTAETQRRGEEIKMNG